MSLHVHCALFVTVRVIAIFIDHLIEYIHTYAMQATFSQQIRSHTQIQYGDAIKFQSKGITQVN